MKLNSDALTGAAVAFANAFSPKDAYFDLSQTLVIGIEQISEDLCLSSTLCTLCVSLRGEKLQRMYATSGRTSTVQVIKNNI